MYIYSMIILSWLGLGWGLHSDAVDSIVASQQEGSWSETCLGRGFHVLPVFSVFSGFWVNCYFHSVSHN